MSSLAADAAIEALQGTARWGVPGATSTDQRRQSIAKDFIDGLREHQIGISMDGKGRWRDNVFVERPWKTIRCQPVDHRTARCRAGPFTF